MFADRNSMEKVFKSNTFLRTYKFILSSVVAGISRTKQEVRVRSLNNYLFFLTVFFLYCFVLFFITIYFLFPTGFFPFLPTSGP